ncbi:ATP synthase f chain, mitochondrial precursor [Savitreella phatthalungensis]
MSLRNLIPPKIANPNAIGVAADAARMTRVVSFYKALPRGPAPKQTGYVATNIHGDKPSGKPMLYLMGGLFLIGYSIDYALHLKHHKNNHH